MGTYTNLITSDNPPTTGNTPPPAAKPVRPAKPTAPKMVRTHARMQTNTHKRKHASKRASMHVSMQNYIEAYLAEKATQGFTFRYPPQLLEELEDIIYAIRKKHKQKLAKNTIAVLALAYVIKDYTENGVDSVLYRALLVK